MAAKPPRIGTKAFLPRADFDSLVVLLRQDGFEVLAPTLAEGVVSLRPIQSAQQIASGLRDEQDGGRYRLMPGEAGLTFEYAVGPDGPKRYLFPPTQRVCQFRVQGGEFILDSGPPQPPKLAFLGIRPCELAAIKVQDRVFGADAAARTFRCESEPYYVETRRQTLAIAVNCTRPGGTCFCASMNTGPQAAEGFDLALTELRAGFLMDVGSQRGGQLAARLAVREPTSAELELAELKLNRAREHMGRRLDTAGLKECLDQTIEHPHWDQVAKRCLACGNCTLVCPTCFCNTVSDSSDLSGGDITRTRQWESCYTHQFSSTTAGPVRNTIRGRYRHWLRHKLGTWWDQFGCSGCVGCGRCITWCPVGIDLTVEARALRDRERSPDSSPVGRASIRGRSPSSGPAQEVTP